MVALNLLAIIVIVNLTTVVDQINFIIVALSLPIPDSLIVILVVLESLVVTTVTEDQNRPH